MNKIAPIGPRDLQAAVFVFDPRIVLDVVREYDPTVVDAAAPFRHTHAPVDACVNRLQHEIILSPNGASAQNPMRIEEATLEMLCRVVRKAYRVHGNRPSKARWPAQKRHRTAIHRSIEFLSRRHAEKLSLSQIAAVTGFSMPYFCRIFRRLTGSTVHAFLTRLRLRFALSELGDTEDMTQLSLAHGFCDSTHFGLAFRREFGVPPTQARDSLFRRASRRATRRVRTCKRH